eukprot:Gb_07056 [translate_table: standard]
MAVLSCNASSFAPIASMGQIRRIASTNNRPQSTLAIARVPFSSSGCIRLSGMREIQAVPAWRQHRFESHCIPSASDGDISIAKSTTESPYEEHQDVAGSAMTVVTGFYEAINRKDMNALSDLVADGCTFPEAFEGRKPVLQFMKDLMDAMGKGMVFVIDGINEGDAFTVEVMWHLKLEGKPFPFTKGCSVFQCEKQGERLLIRDVKDFIESLVGGLDLVSNSLRQLP